VTDLHALPQPPAGPVVIGLDTSLTATGIASSNGWCRTVGYTSRKNPISKLPHRDRLAIMRQVRRGVIDNIGRPDLAVIEMPSFGSTGGAAHERGWLWWRVFEYLADAEVPIALMVPKQRAKYATGNGNADKKAVIAAVKEQWPAWNVRNSDNMADAVALVAAGLDWLGRPLVDLPKSHRDALTNAVWPTEPTSLMGAAA
jgi:crossover junction endodeoxyribonuclease RuvC